MEKKGLKALIGKRTKLVVREPGDTHTKAIFGTIEDIDNGFVLFRSQQGLGSIRLEHVIAIKPAGGDDK